MYTECTPLKCDNCGKEYANESELRFKLHEIKDLFMRIGPGGIVPAGECNECDALVYPVAVKQAMLGSTPMGGQQENTFTIFTGVEVTDQQVQDLLTCAMEGGSNYWYIIDGYELPEGKTKGDFEFPHCQVPFAPGGAIIISDREGDPDLSKKRLDRPTMLVGLTAMANYHRGHWNDFINDNADADTGDVFLQCCLFGNIIFG